MKAHLGNEKGAQKSPFPVLRTNLTCCSQALWDIRSYRWPPRALRRLLYMIRDRGSSYPVFP